MGTPKEKVILTYQKGVEYCGSYLRAKERIEELKRTDQLGRKPASIAVNGVIVMENIPQTQ